MSEAPTPSAGWYVNPEDESELRFWTGTAWSSMRKVREHAGPALPAYGQAPVAAPETPILVPALLAGGGLLVLGGIGRAVSYLLPYELFGAVLLASIIEVIGWVGAFVAFVLAGYPSRRTAPRTLGIVLVGVYAVGGFVGIAVAANPYVATGLFALVALFGFVALGVGIAFAVTALRSPAVARRLRALPLALYLGLIAFGVAAGVVDAAIAAGAPLPVETGILVAGLSGFVPITIGALFLAFGRSPNVSTAAG